MIPLPTPQLLAHCPLCQAAYDDASVRPLGESSLTPIAGAHGKSKMFHLTCKNCFHAVLAVILESSHGVSSIGLVTDLEASDALRVQDAPPISADDVVRAHLELDTRSQDLCLNLSKTSF
jgi:hypothetical protein